MTFSGGVTGNVNVNLGNGNDVLQIGGAATTTVFAHNLTIAAGNGNDTVSIANASVANNLTITGGTGTDTFLVGGSQPAADTIGGNLSLSDGGGQGNIMAVFNTNVGGSATIAGTGVADQIQVGSDAGLGKLTDPSATGQVNIGTTLQIQSKNGGDYLAVVNTNIADPVSINTGNSADPVLLGAVLDPGANANVLHNLVFGTVNVGGNLQVQTGNGTGAVVLAGANVTGNTDILTGNGTNLVSILGGSAGVDATFGGTVTIDTGKGLDDVLLGVGAVFNGAVSVTATNPLDAVLSAGATFNQSVTVNGTNGITTLTQQAQNLVPNVLNAVLPIVTGIENDLQNVVAPTEKDIEAAFGSLEGLLGL